MLTIQDKIDVRPKLRIRTGIRSNPNPYLWVRKFFISTLLHFLKIRYKYINTLHFYNYSRVNVSLLHSNLQILFLKIRFPIRFCIWFQIRWILGFGFWRILAKRIRSYATFKKFWRWRYQFSCEERTFVFLLLFFS